MSDEKREGAPGPTPPQAGGPASAPAAGETIPGLGGAPDLKERVVEVLQTCYDPEIPVNIYELGLIYGIDVTAEGEVAIVMTLTSPACPVAGSLPPEVEAKVRALPGVSAARVDVVWDPPWSPERMSDAAKLQLNMF